MQNRTNLNIKQQQSSQMNKASVHHLLIRLRICAQVCVVCNAAWNSSDSRESYHSSQVMLSIYWREEGLCHIT